MELGHSSGERLLYDRQGAAFALSVSLRTVDYYLARGEFETRHIGRKYLITAASLRKFAAGNHFGPVSKGRDEEERKAA